MASRVKFDQGVCTSRDPADLANGEAVSMTGLFYKPGDTSRAWKVYGRSEFDDTGSAAKIKGLALCKFDSGGTDSLVAYSGTTYYSATPGATGTFASLQTGRNASGTHLTGVHYNDKWYLGNGYDRNTVLESDGTVRDHGMLEPQEAAVCAASAGGVVNRPDTHTGSDFVNTSLVWDSAGNYTDTYSHAALAAAGVKTGVWSGFTTDTADPRRLYVRWGLSGLPPDGVERETREFDASVLIEYSTDSGVSWDDLVSYAHRTSSVSAGYAQVAVSVDPEDVYVRATLTYHEGTRSCALRIYDINIATGGTLTPFDTVVGLYYAYTEYDADKKLESVPCVTEGIVTTSAASSHNTVVVTLPNAPTNSNATTWKIYRTHDGGTAPQDLRYIGEAEIADDTFIDIFSPDKDTPGTDTIALLKFQIDSEQDGIYVPANGSPGAFVHMNVYGPFVVGLSPQFPRTLYYSLPGSAEYWPAIYLVDSFPLPERDELVTTATVGDTLLVAAKEAMMAIDGLPEATGGLYQSATVRVLKGQPGCVSRYGMTAFSVEGEPRAAWVSPFGIHITNGQTAKRISDDIAWEDTVSEADLDSCVLHWDHKRSCLVFAYDSDGAGTNDLYWLIHMGPEHLKGNGQPKWTGPHYGEIACMASGMVSNEYRVYSGHVSDGSVYLEMDSATGLDASESYSGTQLPAIYVSGKNYEGHDNIEVDWLNIKHTDWGNGQTATLSWTTGTDYTNTSTTTTKTIAFDSHRGTEVYIGRAGEWHEFTLTHTGTGNGALLDMRVRGSVTDETGET